MSKSSIFGGLVKLDDACISAWSLFQCSLDDVFFKIVKKYASPTITQQRLN